MAVSRRSFLTKGSVAAAGAAGAAVAGISVTAAGAAETELNAEEIAASIDPVLLQVLDAANGEVELLVRDQSIVFTDKKLVARVLRASR